MTDEYNDTNLTEKIARVCYEANREWSRINGVERKPWDEADEWERDTMRRGVIAAQEGQSPEQLHDSWVQTKLEDGWSYGETRDPDAKTHPCLVPYDQLPEDERMKDYIFRAITLAMSPPSKEGATSPTGFTVGDRVSLQGAIQAVSERSELVTVLLDEGRTFQLNGNELHPVD